MTIDLSRRTKLLFCLAMAASAALYWPGLFGPLVFDDYWNLAPVYRWYAGKDSWFVALLPNSDSIIFSRPLAMGSFMLTTWLGGSDSTFPLKFGNLVIHLFCAVLGWQILLRSMREDPRLSPNAAFVAVVATTFWLIHPLHVSTVLYAVQRMAQLSALFTLAAVIVYLVARRQLIAGRLCAAILNLFVSIPLLVAAGVLSKQNAAIAPFLCLVLELAYFHGQSQHRRVLVIFYGLFVALPILAVAAILITAPQRILAGYGELEFTLIQRLLTQPHVLLDYIGMWFVPRGPLMGLYTDDFPISTGLLSPSVTLWAIVIMAAISALAILMRKRIPSFFAGWFFFLVAHGVESTFLPLEMYYEHRNYLPSLGLLLAVAGAGSFFMGKLKPQWQRLRSFMLVGLTGLALVLAFTTLGRVLVWQTEESMVNQGLLHHPDSLRLRLDRTALALRTKDYSDAVATLTPLLTHSDPRHRLVGRMDLIAVNCARGMPVDPQEFELAVADAQPVLTVNEVSVAILLDSLTRNGYCKSIPPGEIAGYLAQMVDAASSQPENTNNKSTIRRITAQIYIRAGMWHEAERQAEIGWEAFQTMPLGVTLARCYLENGKHTQAVEVMAELKRMVRPLDKQWQQELTVLRKLIENRE